MYLCTEISISKLSYESEAENKGMDAAHRDGDGSIRLSFVPYHAGAGACCRSGAGNFVGSSSASVDLSDAVSDFLQDRA